MITGNGPKILFPNRFAEELGTNPNLSFNEGFATVCSGNTSPESSS